MNLPTTTNLDVGLFKATLERIKSNPAMWNQNYYWSDGLRGYCFAGHVEAVVTGYDPEPDSETCLLAILRLKLTQSEALWLLSTKRTLEEFEQVLTSGIFCGLPITVTETRPRNREQEQLND